ncbi:glycosyl transferase family 17 [Candidatus Pelagibacter sp.]|nr:glycosyl transferase family 17 [Candidatus Pelagibacter sp.]MDA9594760.1 glycosyl transferase family 17 [Candidatus Pelagibacter sp.]
MHKNKIVDCITFFDNNFMFDLRYNILKNYVDFFVICESKYDHKGKEKKKNFIFKDSYDNAKVKYIFLDTPFPKNNNPWKNQALQREFLLNSLTFIEEEDYIFFSDPDEILNPKVLINFNLEKKYGIFLQDCFNFKFNLFNPYESPWEGTRVSKKKNLKSIDYMRQKIKMKNLNYSFLRIDKEKNIQIFKDAGWHFNNILSPKEISLKLKTYAHTEFSSDEFSNEKIIKQKIENNIDLFNRGHKYVVKKIDKSFPKYLIENIERFKEWFI